MMQHPLIARIRRDRNLTGLLRNSGIMYASGILTIGLTFVQQIATAKLLGPADYGRLATVLGSSAFLLLLLDVRTWELGTKLLARPVLDNAHDESVRIVNWLIAVDLCLGLVGALLLLLAADWVATELLKAPDLAGLVRLYAISLPFKQVGSSGPLALVRLRDRFDWLSIKSVFYAVARLLLLTGPALLGFGLAGVIVGAILTEFINMAAQMLMFVLLWRKMPARTRLIDLTRPAQFVEGRRLLVSLWFSATLQALQLETFVPLMALLTTPTDVGLFRLGLDMAQLVSKIAEPISLVIQPTIIKLYETDLAGQFAHYIKQVFLVLSVIVVPFVLAIVLLGPKVLPLFLDQSYLPAIPILAVLSIGLGSSTLALWIRPAIVALKITGKQNIVGLIALCFSITAMVLVAPRYGAIGGAVVMSGFLLLYNLLSAIVVIRSYRSVRQERVRQLGI